MSALNLLNESTHEPNLTWLLWLVLAIFVVIVIVGWLVSNKEDEEPVAPPVHVEEKTEEAPALSADPDNLKKLEGIGPKVEQVLNDAGVSTYAALAAANTEELREVLVAAKLRMMDPAGWIEQAEIAAKGDWDALATLQDELKGGRRV